MERTCQLLSCVQDLVIARLIEAQRVQFDLWELLAPMIQDQRILLQSAGVGIAVAQAEPWEPIVGDEERTKQALKAVLKLAASVSSRGDVIELHSSHPNGFAELTLQNTRSHGKRMNSSQRLNLSLAEVNILSQHGRYHFAEDPFRVSLALPMQDLGPVRGEMVLCNSNTNWFH